VKTVPFSVASFEQTLLVYILEFLIVVGLNTGREDGSLSVIGLLQKGKRDISAGIIVAILLVPQGIAYSLLVGLPPEFGLYTALVPALVYLIFGASPHVSVGPVAMVSLLLFAGVSNFAEPGTIEYVNLIFTVTLLVGCIQWLLSLFKVGKMIDYVPYSVMKGFTSACAILIGLSQIDSLLGVRLEESHSALQKVVGVVQHVHQMHFPTIIISLLSLTILFIAPRLKLRFPGLLIVVIISTAYVASFQLDDKGVEIVGLLPSGIPTFFHSFFKY
jgi:SulP family sulfate permease